MIDTREQTGSRSQNLELVSDMELVRRCALRETLALQELTRRYESVMSRFLSFLLPASEQVESAVVCLFLNVWQEARHYKSDCPVKLWLYRLARQIAQNPDFTLSSTASLPKSALSSASLPKDPKVQRPTRWNEELSSLALRQALRRLSAFDRLLMTLHYSENVDYAQMQVITHLPSPYLKFRFALARRRLSRLLNR